ncbi:MAG: phage antirepressor KilAC domain-containing protein [Roseateles sp.]|uniref:phage antirepressor KilAC domain-containing protein n=1 Tax=Roseateles sp. TaxID=1971397 RepID=UPI004034F77B
MELVTQAPTMTSREIAELVKTSHDSVLKTVRALIERGVVSGNETPYTHPQNGQTYSEFRLNYRDTMVVASGYSVELRAKVIDRWQELEAQGAPTFQVPTSLAGALRLAAEQAERIEQQQAQIEAAAPAVAFVDRFVQADGLKGFRETCKLLKANEARFTEFVLAKKIMYRLAGKLTAHQQHIDAGRFVVRAGVATATEHAFTTTKFTAKGVNWIAGEWAKHCLAAEAVEA